MSAACKGTKTGQDYTLVGTNSNVLLTVCESRYLDHVHPLSYVEEAALTGDVVQQ